MTKKKIPRNPKLPKYDIGIHIVKRGKDFIIFKSDNGNFKYHWNNGWVLGRPARFASKEAAEAELDKMTRQKIFEETQIKVKERFGVWRPRDV